MDDILIFKATVSYDSSKSDTIWCDKIKIWPPFYVNLFDLKPKKHCLPIYTSLIKNLNSLFAYLALIKRIQSLLWYYFIIQHFTDIYKFQVWIYKYIQ